MLAGGLALLGFRNRLVNIRSRYVRLKPVATLTDGVSTASLPPEYVNRGAVGFRGSHLDGGHHLINHDKYRQLGHLVQVGALLMEMVKSIKLILYGLYQLQDGTCMPYIVPQQLVFFFDEFRTAAPHYEGRRAIWLRNIREVVMATCKSHHQ